MDCTLWGSGNLGRFSGFNSDLGMSEGTESTRRIFGRFSSGMGERGVELSLELRFAREISRVARHQYGVRPSSSLPTKVARPRGAGRGETSSRRGPAPPFWCTIYQPPRTGPYEDYQ